MHACNLSMCCFKLLLNILYRHTPLMAFVLRNLERHISEYHDKIYMPDTEPTCPFQKYACLEPARWCPENFSLNGSQDSDYSLVRNRQTRRIAGMGHLDQIGQEQSKGQQGCKMTEPLSALNSPHLSTYSVPALCMYSPDCQES